ncbi:SE1832 family protein [Sinobaca sp. H24]|uniref:SE1832 family protein n=1 Tax=Sinobaca sp. H24 TaxID=2923376 RepID=UPI0020793977|nr:SE1832 family protein [Sinobaca sp. H24]
MDNKAKEEQLAWLKSEYVRVQGDLEKLESVGRSPDAAVNQLTELEEQIAEIRKK